MTHQAPLVWCHCCLPGWWPSSSTLAYASIEAPSPHGGWRCRWMQCQWTQQTGTCTVRAVSGEETCIHVEIQFYHGGELHLSSLCLQVNGRNGNTPQCIAMHYSIWKFMQLHSRSEIISKSYAMIKNRISLNIPYNKLFYSFVRKYTIIYHPIIFRIENIE